MSQKPPPSLSPLPRVILSLVLPVLGALIINLVAAGSINIAGGEPREIVLQLAGVGLISWLLGLVWYGLPGTGLRLGRPLYAGIGFAVLAWLIFLVVRLTVEVEAYGGSDSGRSFLYILIFEAFCVQLWTFGLFFRSVADWRGPLTAAVSSGILFGAVAFLFFQESFTTLPSGLLFFTVWGVLYGIIRLRTGSLLGTVIVQAMQSFTGWQVMIPKDPPDTAQLRILYLATSALYGILIWRLWPKVEDDYRV
ncbi:MAG: CPBP family intramembrane glutamic endopeptidase [Candidatus Promineifilaceae bacterium]|jgi:membrane protease YdiL (CAAX protease family)